MASKSHLYIPALGEAYELLAPYSELLLRAGLGTILVVHGLQKFLGWFGGAGIERTAQLLDKFGYPVPLILTYVIAGLETFGGFLLMAGLFVRPTAFALVIFMLFAVHYTAVTSGFIWLRGGCEYPLTILFISFYYLVNGAGTLSLDFRRGRQF